jgi:hypothetical protein
MEEITVNVLTICGSLRKGSYNAMVRRSSLFLELVGRSERMDSFGSTPAKGGARRNWRGIVSAT